MLAIAFGILASLCFAAASLLAQRGLYMVPTPWGAWVTLVANTVFLLAFHFVALPERTDLRRSTISPLLRSGFSFRE